MISDTSERFLDLATKPLAGNHELNAQARREISSKLKPEMDDELEESSKRLETSDRSKWKPAWVGLGLVLFGMGLLGLSASRWLPKRHIAKYMLGFSRYVDWPEELTKAKRLMARGLPVSYQMLVENQFDKLQDLHPSDPLYFAPRFQYECQSDPTHSGKAALAMLDRVSKIDPDNGWWPYIADIHR